MATLPVDPHSQTWIMNHVCLVRKIFTTVGGFNPFEEYWSKWESSPNRGENKTYLKPTPSSYLYCSTNLWKALTKQISFHSKGLTWLDLKCIMSHKQAQLTNPCVPSISGQHIPNAWSPPIFLMLVCYIFVWSSKTLLSIAVSGSLNMW